MQISPTHILLIWVKLKSLGGLKLRFKVPFISVLKWKGTRMRASRSCCLESFILVFINQQEVINQANDLAIWVTLHASLAFRAIKTISCELRAILICFFIASAASCAVNCATFHRIYLPDTKQSHQERSAVKKVFKQRLDRHFYCFTFNSSDDIIKLRQMKCSKSAIST